MGCRSEHSIIHKHISAISLLVPLSTSRYQRLVFSIHISLGSLVLGSSNHQLFAEVFQGIMPKAEVRAVWVTTTSSLDWPKSRTMEGQQESLRTMVRRLKGANFNTIFFQVRARGDAYYRSRYEPWADNLTGVPGKDPGWDPLAFLLTEAHAAGLEVHGWFNVYKVRGLNPPGRAWPPHVMYAYPHWVRDYRGEGWLDPGLPEVRTHLLRVALDLVRSYDIDGITFDYMRYPGNDFRDNNTYKRFGRGQPLDDWRRHNIDTFIGAFYDSAVAAKPMLKVGAAPLGLYDGETRGNAIAGSYHWFYQDSQGWLKRKHLDYVAPQIYWTIGMNNGQGFALLARSWQRNSNGRHVYPAVAAHKPDVLREIPAQIDSTRACGASGQSFFRYESIESLAMFNGRYDSPATIPPMPWKDSIPPLPPRNFTVTELAPDIFRLAWMPAPPASDGDVARYYAVYRSTTQPIPVNAAHSRIAVTASNVPFLVDTIRGDRHVRYYYAVTAFDKGNNESTSAALSEGEVNELAQLNNRLARRTNLSVSVSPEEPIPVMIAYELEERSVVLLQIIEKLGSGNEALIASLAEGPRQKGTHLVGVGKEWISSRRYLVRLKSRPVQGREGKAEEDTTLERPLDVLP